MSRRDHSGPLDVAIIGIALVVGVLGCCGDVGHAQQREPAALPLARVCWLESGWSASDCAAIHYVITRRARNADVEYGVMLARYSAITSSTDRAALARHLPDADEPTWSAADNRRWATLRQLAADLTVGSVADPCVPATHWGGGRVAADRERLARAVRSGRWRIVRCEQPTRNTFAVEVGR
jgi:hypothetical protein